MIEWHFFYLVVTDTIRMKRAEVKGRQVFSGFDNDCRVASGGMAI